MAEIKVTLKGSFSNRDASIDDHPVLLMGTGGVQSASASFTAAGDHKLKWVVTGAPDAHYSVTLSGDVEAWSEDFTMPSGRDAGVKRFHVK